MADEKPAFALYVLSAGNFIVGIGAFVVIGILGPILRDLGISQSQAGALLTVYALVYAVASPILVALTGRLRRRDVMLAGLGIFLGGAALSAYAASYEILIAARVVSALGAAMFTPVASAAAAALVAPAARAQALGIVFGGLTLAQVAGVPLGSYLGYEFGWRTAFAAVAVLGIGVVVAVLRAVPRTIEVPPVTLGDLGRVLKTPSLVGAVAFTAVFVGALYVVYTFVGPMMESRFDLDSKGVTLFLAVFGAGAVVGNAVGTYLAQRLGPRNALMLLCTAQIVLLSAITLLPLGWLAALATTFVWSVAAWSFMVPQQMRLVTLAPKAQGLLLALNASALYLGASLGSTVGGFTLRHGTYEALGPVAAAVVAVAFLAVWRHRGTAQ